MENPAFTVVFHYEDPETGDLRTLEVQTNEFDITLQQAHGHNPRSYVGMLAGQVIEVSTVAWEVTSWFSTNRNIPYHLQHSDYLHRWVFDTAVPFVEDESED